MSVFRNLKKVKNIFCNETQIKEVRANNQIVYRRDTIDSTYNYFVFSVEPMRGYTVTLENNRRGDTTEWDGLTDWGDGTIDNKLSHKYANDGTYVVITKWMISSNTETNQMFVACNNINRNITDVIDLFRACRYLVSIDMSRFKAKNVTDMQGMFYNCTSLRELNIKGWDTSSVTNMKDMFNNCGFVPNVSHLNVSNVTVMESMFYNCSIDGSQFKNWDISSAKDMDSMFYGSTITNCLDLSSWDVSDINSFNYMFSECTAKNHIDISYWDINDNASTYYMFANNSCGTCINVNHHVKHAGVSSSDWQRMIADN